MTLFELLMGLSEALEEAEKTEKTEKPEPEPKSTPKIEPKVVFVLEFSSTVINNGISTNQHGTMGAFTDLRVAMQHAVAESANGDLSFSHSSNNTYIALELFKSNDGLEYNEYTIKQCNLIN